MKNYPNGSYYMLNCILENLVGKTNYEVVGTLNVIYQSLDENQKCSKISKEEIIGLKKLIMEVVTDLNKQPMNNIYESNNVPTYSFEEELKYCL